ncbi:DNA-dependent protein kinase catalytic subunit-like, partial [Uranotaenia lowii]|uniref:DNA-dependent protein kinase catalytic subunit-like n=1 Tax=Uranotaenia lowii TaxID=190385 RepID=UPI00247ABB3E
MSTDLEKYLSSMKGCLDTQHGARARDYVQAISDLVLGSEQLNPAEAEYYLDTIFNSQNGTLAFMQRSLKAAGRFQKANEDLFELYRKLVQKHEKLVRKSAQKVLKECVRFIQSSSASARERELATALVQDLLLYKCLDEDCDISHLLGELLAVFEQRKLTNRFQQALFELVGLLARDYPECVSESRQRLILTTIMAVAEGQLLEKNYPSLVSLAGALQGLNYFLVNFAPTTADDGACEGSSQQPQNQQWRERIYVLIKKLSDWDEAVKERLAFRNAMLLLERHAPLFSNFLYSEYTYWQTILTTKWIRSNLEDRKVGIYTLHSFHKEIAQQLVNRAEQSSSTEDDRQSRVAVLNYFMKYFRTILLASSSKPFEVRIAIRGFGSMAGPCSRLMSEEFMNEVLLLVMQRTEYVYLVENKNSDLLEHLPDFVQALSDIMSHVKELTGVQIVSLQNIIIGLIKDFHYLSSTYHELIVNSLMKTFENLSKLGGTVLNSLLDKVVLRGLIWTCSHTLVIDVNQDADETSNWKDYITYKHYLPLWKGILSPGSSFHSDRSPLIKTIYDHLVNNLFLLLDKINLETRKRTIKDATGEDHEMFFCDPNIDLVPVKPKDFHIFFNLVDLYQDLFRYNTTIREYFEDWIPLFFDYMIRKSLKYPLVSGLVKLIDLGMYLANQLQYFKSNPMEPSFTKASTINLLVYYLELQIAKARHSTGELQITCLRFILGAPVILLESFLENSQELMDIFRISLQLGKGILSLANAVLSCLQQVSAYDSPISREHRESLIARTLPLFDTYLQTNDSTQAVPTNARLVKFQRKRSVQLSASKIEKIKLQHALESSESELLKFQLRILLFLGELEPSLCIQMVQNRDNNSTTADRPLVLWDLDSNSSITLQLLARVGMRPIIKLDTIIARVCSLAVGSSDRKTKVAACELLHALVLYIIGIGYQDRMTKL